MPIAHDELERVLRDAFPDARIDLVDTAGDLDHWDVTLVSAAFAGKSPLAQHRLVYAALGDRMRAQIHALSLKTSAP